MIDALNSGLVVTLNTPETIATSHPGTAIAVDTSTDNQQVDVTSSGGGYTSEDSSTMAPEYWSEGSGDTGI